MQERRKEISERTSASILLESRCCTPYHLFRDAEADYIASLEAALSGGTTWNRICDLVDLQNSQSKTIARAGAGTTDLTRFKEILLRLKRKGDQAPGAAGY